MRCSSQRFEILTSLFQEYRVETCENLQDIYTDESTVKKIQALLKPVIFKMSFAVPVRNSETMIEGNDMGEWMKHFR